MTKEKKSSEKVVPSKEKKPYTFPIGFFEARRIEKKLERFEYLVRYYFDRPGEAEGLPSLDTLIKDYDEAKKKEMLRAEINKITYLVNSYFKRVGGSAKYTYAKPLENGRTDFNIVTEALYAAPPYIDARYTALVDELQRYRGLYGQLWRMTLKRSWKPTAWCAWLINMPARILRDAGVSMENEKTSKFYYLILQILTGLLLTLLIIQAGIDLDLSKLIGKMLHVG